MKREGVVVVVEEADRYLMIRRAPGILAGGAWCFVGGGIDPGETQSQAVEREWIEEVGGRVSAVEKVWEWERPDGRLLLHWWTARLLDRRLKANPAEVSELAWLTVDEIDRLPEVLASNREFLGFWADRSAAPEPLPGR